MSAQNTSEIDYYFVRERLYTRDIATCYVPTKFQLTDIFTKALGRDQFQAFLNKLGIWDLHAPTWQGVLRDILFILRIMLEYFPLLRDILFIPRIMARVFFISYFLYILNLGM